MIVKTNLNIPVPSIGANITGLHFSEYRDGNLACLARLSYPDDTEDLPISVNIPEEARELKGGEFFAKNWSENEAIFNALVESGELVVMEKSVATGYVVAPVCHLKDVPPHDCDENAVTYKSDGALGHGWECGLCGRFLQAG